jgi:hypothetical protein
MKRKTVPSEPPASPAAQPQYGKTLLGLASEFHYYNPSGEEHDKLVALLDRCVHVGFTLEESCWGIACPIGLWGVAYNRLVEHAEDFNTLDLIFERESWLADFITDVLSLYRHRNGDVTPENLLRVLAQQHNEFMGNLGDASRFLRDHPESAQDEVRKAAAALPDTHQSADQDQCGASLRV